MPQKGAKKSLVPVLGFLLPNLLGFMAFTLFPVVFSFWMAFTNWTPKPAVHLEFLGLRNFTDLLGVSALSAPRPGLAWGYGLCVLAIVLGLVGALWANMAAWRGMRAGGGVLAALGLALLWSAIFRGGGDGVGIVGVVTLFGGIAVMRREDISWRPGIGTVPALLLALGALGLALLNGVMWSAYEPRDLRFWQYFYNTAYLMIGIPFSIAGSLLLALLLNDELPLGPRWARPAGALLCVVGGALTLLIGFGAGHADLGLLAAVLWGIAALGVAFNVVTFRTLFYLPTFTAGVALMILWKALYNPQTGPINAGLRALFPLLHIQAAPPEWLSSVEWAKPALIAMGVWTSIGGTNMLLYLAGLANVPKELLDAAEVDGAGAWNRFRHVTWPQLAPTTFFISIMAIIGGLQGGFEQARVMTGGGPAGATTTLSYYIYNKAFQDLDLGYAAAISWVLFAIVFIATALNWRFGKGLEVE
ncbi:MAG TPA: sugar ABC transporter permease [Chthonomonadaceae bacterium]|nr:sugar ABC transporter permease [Chthonomonadaceae bacterium]